jgi:hypothetical protein
MSRVPGILRTSTSSILEVVERSMTFPLPEDVVPGRRARGRRGPGRRRAGARP